MRSSARSASSSGRSKISRRDDSRRRCSASCTSRGSSATTRNIGHRSPSVGRMSMRITNSFVVAACIVCMSGSALAGGEYEEARMAAGDRARNLAVSHEVEALIQQKEGEVAVKRRQGIVLLETYLREHGPTPETAEVMFQLAELKWEEAKSQF